jgi:alpha-L-rhamnosidase
LKQGYFPPTLEANLFALDRGVVTEERRKEVIDMVTADVAKGNVGGGIMTGYYLLKQLYALDRPEFDRLILDLMRKKFQAMADSPLGCSWESYTGGSKAHIYGMYPGYFLSAYVLGVRRDDPVALRKLLIEPHLGNLTRAEGTVVTEFGPVEVSWSKDGGRLRGEITIPEGVKTTLALPAPGGSCQALIDGKPVTGTAHGSRLLIPLSPGKHLLIYGTEAHDATPASTPR